MVSTSATHTFWVIGDRTLVANFAAVPVGAIGGTFSVDQNRHVFFSQGNLQYIGSAPAPYWKFAENQWDYFGETTGQGSESQTVDRDLFGWGTSGWDNGNTYYQPWSTGEGVNEQGYGYGPTNGTNYTYDLAGTYSNADWGHNAISNGGNTPDQWRTLTKNEWVFLFNTRGTTSCIRYAKAMVNGVNGVILLPDDWSAEYYALNSPNTINASFTTNIVTDAQWITLEQHGAVFLPAAGYRSGTLVDQMNSHGYYWSASYYDNQLVRCVVFYNGYIDAGYGSYRYCGRSVRLVRPME